jgi:hypothetical protein
MLDGVGDSAVEAAGLGSCAAVDVIVAIDGGAVAVVASCDGTAAGASSRLSRKPPTNMNTLRTVAATPSRSERTRLGVPVREESV